MLILKRSSLPVSLRKLQPSGSSLAFLIAHVCLCCIVVSCVLGSVAICLNNCSKFVQNTTSPPPQVIQWFCLISSLSQTHFDGPWHCKDAQLTYSCLKINLCFGPPAPPSPHEVWAWSFSAPVYISNSLSLCDLYYLSLPFSFSITSKLAD